MISIRNKVLEILGLFIQVILLNVFVQSGFNDHNWLTFQFIILSSLLVISGDILTLIFAAISGLSLSVMVLKIGFIQNLFNEQSIFRLATLVLTLTVISAIIIRFLNIFKYSKLNYRYKILYLLTSTVITYFATIFFSMFNRLKDSEVMRFIRFAGEDNNSWINWLAQGYSENGYRFLNVGNGDIKPATNVVLSVFRTWANLDNTNLQLTLNVRILQQIYLMTIFFGILAIALSTALLLMKNKINSFLIFCLTILNSLIAYLAFASFAEFGHLPPMISLVFIFVAIFILLLSESEIQKKYQQIFLLALISVILATSGDGWYPIRPAIYVAILWLILENLPFQATVRQKITSTISNFDIYLLSLLVICLAFGFGFVQEDIELKIDEYSRLVHLLGGTLKPGIIQVIIFSFIFPLMMISKKINLFLNLDKVKPVYFGFLLLYFFVIFISLSTAPYSIDYAGQKLGLFLSTLTLPLAVTMIAILIDSASKFNQLDRILVTVISSGLLVLQIGPPTSSSDPAWNQFAYPFGSLQNIQEADTFVWEGLLIDKLNNPHDKKYLCFDRHLPNMTDPMGCSLYARAIQGISEDSQTSFWLSITRNYVSEQEYLNWLPADFYENYQILFLDDYVEGPVDSQINQVNGLIPRS